MNRSYPALRGVAILLVILNHSIHMAVTYADSLGWLDKSAAIYRVLSVIQGLGAFAVPIFLFLSGCFFAYAASRGDLSANYRVVLVNLKHVAIPYLIWSLIFYAEILIFHGTRFSALEYVKNLLVGYPFNFVPLLIFYYVVSPLLIRLFRRIGWWMIGLIGLYQIFLLVVLNPQQVGLELPGVLRLLAPPVLSLPLSDWALYFPLGLVAVLQADRLSQFIPKVAWLLAGLTVVLFGLGVLDMLGIVNAPLMRQLCPIPFILLSTTFQRNRIPQVRPLELLGKRAYGLYLTNLLVLDLALLLIQAVAPGVLAYYALLTPVLAALALFIPLVLIMALERRLKPVTFRYAFG